VSFRITDPDDGSTQRRHVPRLRVGDPLRSSDVTTFLGGGSAVRRRLLEQVGGLPDEFFYAHEETDLAWRALDAGWRIRYDASCVMHHPATAPTRHASYLRLNARNRAWLARRNLPAALVPVYLLCWVVLTVVRVREPGALRTWFRGLAEGLTTACGPRRPMRWATVWKMARLGRPPLL
jgi:GT2 family glycosyltransferase